jgi:DNA-binding IscR family transcriptional regulator
MTIKLTDKMLYDLKKDDIVACIHSANQIGHKVDSVYLSKFFDIEPDTMTRLLSMLKKNNLVT